MLSHSLVSDLRQTWRHARAPIRSSAAATSFPNPPAIGGRMRMFMSDAPWMTVGGIVMHAVATRTREIGVRRSLGASNGSLARLVLGQVAGLIALGVALGLGLGFAGSRMLGQFAFEAAASNPWRLGLVALILVSSALPACVAPLMRALRIDPVRALRP